MSPKGGITGCPSRSSAPIPPQQRSRGSRLTPSKAPGEGRGRAGGRLVMAPAAAVAAEGLGTLHPWLPARPHAPSPLSCACWCVSSSAQVRTFQVGQKRPVVNYDQTTDQGWTSWLTVRRLIQKPMPSILPLLAMNFWLCWRTSHLSLFCSEMMHLTGPLRLSQHRARKKKVVQRKITKVFVEA